MIISHRHELIFFKPYKVGSTSVMYALGAQCGPDDTVGQLETVWERDGVVRVEDLGRNYERYGLVRTLPDGRPACQIHARPRKIRRAVGALWDSYLKVTIVRNPWDRAVSMYAFRQRSKETARTFDECLENVVRPYWLWPDRSRTADVYLRYERLQDDYEALCDRIGMEALELPRFFSSWRDRSKPYWEYFDDRTRAMVAKNHDWELEEFGYRFGE